MPRCLPIMTSFFDRFLIDFCSQLGLPNPEKSRPHSCESTIFLKSHFDVHMDFWLDFGANLAPRWLPKSSQKSIPRGIDFLIDFCIDFLFILSSNLGPNLAPCWPLFRPKLGDGLRGYLFFVGSMLFFDFFERDPWGTPSARAPKPMGYPSWARFSGPCGLGFQRFCGPFCKFCGSFFGFPFGAV